VKSFPLIALSNGVIPCDIVIEVKFLSHFSFVEVKDVPGTLFLKIDGSILISIPFFSGMWKESWMVVRVIIFVIIFIFKV